MTWRNRLMSLAVGAALLPAPLALAADHLDGAKVKLDASTDINDLYSWMSADGLRVIMAMTVSPAATIAAAPKFSTAAYYVFHTVARTSAVAVPTANPVDVICSFDAAQKISCWVGGNTTFVNGDASMPAGISSSDAKVKVFAGLRKDHFFFNLNGYNAVRAYVTMNGGGLTFDVAGCPTLSAAQSTALVTQLARDTPLTVNGIPGAAAGPDFFKTFDTLAIVVEVDKTLISSAANPILSVSAATVKM